MKKTLLVACLTFATAITSHAQLIAGWDFTTTTNGGTAVVASPNTPTQFTANVGLGTIYLNGTSGSSTWLPATELNGFGGTTVNATNGLSTSVTSPSDLGLLGGTSFSANGKSIVFAFSTTGFTNGISVSYALRGSATGFTSEAWEYSTDAITWSSLQTISSIPSSYTLTTLGTTNALDNAATAYLRLTFNGATNATGNNRIDNIQIVAVPEPGTVALVALGLGAVLFGVRRKRA